MAPAALVIPDLLQRAGNARQKTGVWVLENWIVDLRRSPADAGNAAMLLQLASADTMKQASLHTACKSWAASRSPSVSYEQTYKGYTVSIKHLEQSGRLQQLLQDPLPVAADMGSSNAAAATSQSDMDLDVPPVKCPGITSRSDWFRRAVDVGRYQFYRLAAASLKAVITAFNAGPLSSHTLVGRVGGSDTSNPCYVLLADDVKPSTQDDMETDSHDAVTDAADYVLRSCECTGFTPVPLEHRGGDKLCAACHRAKRSSLRHLQVQINVQIALLFHRVRLSAHLSSSELQLFVR